MLDQPLLLTISIHEDDSIYIALVLRMIYLIDGIAAGIFCQQNFGGSNSGDVGSIQNMIETGQLGESEENIDISLLQL